MDTNVSFERPSSGPSESPLAIVSSAHTHYPHSSPDFGLTPLADYAAFLEATGWAPVDKMNFLAHWDGEATYPEGTGAQPVTWVSVGDAAAYCGKRPPRVVARIAPAPY